MRNIAGIAYTGDVENVLPATDLTENRLLAIYIILIMHYGTNVTPMWQDVSNKPTVR